MTQIDAGSCGSTEPFALQIIGSDMAPEFEDGHIIIVDPGGQLTTGCFVVARAEGDVILRQLTIEGENFRLAALSAVCDDIVLNRADCDLIGVVSQRSGSRRKYHKRYDT